ncbi:Flp pilus assembly protein CpaB [Rhizobium terrae]|uniref:Flp pilus assembly protein CpaB n=1 Tax=Rhizobium terrae TaxID=2171756 RepID=UPI000E3B67E0|nr:Flp pilus assembly protein CpaB [Rhizobium terrae]
MKPTRIIILAVAVAAAGLAGLLAMRLSGAKAPEMVQTVVQKEPTVRVLVSAENLPVGSRLNDKAMQWVVWPKSGIAEGFITDASRPDAIKELQGTVVRMPMFKGEPVRAEKIADSSSRIMASLLPSGKRAVSTEISVATGAGGFVLPNDRVDIIMVRENKDGGGYITENILSNIRVLAIDQQIHESEDGKKAVVGTTATLELTPDQAKVIAVAQQMAERLTLALRSVADSQEADTAAADYLLRGGDGKADIQVIKSGTVVKNTPAQAK